jgi:hypothetical protein
MSSPIPGPGRPTAPRSSSRFLRNIPRKVSLVAGLAAVLTIMIGAGFASMRASGSATSLETLVVRWTAVGFLAIGAAAYVIGGRVRSDNRS